MSDTLLAPFPFFGGKRKVVDLIWQRLGYVKQYIEPFCGSAAVLLGAPEPAALEVVNDLNGFIANFWRAVKHNPRAVAREADHPVSHIDLGARHAWLMQQRDRVGAELQDALWPGDARVAGWWLWGQCSWIGSGWCDWFKGQARGKVPHVSDAGRGVQARGQVPHVSSAGRGVQARAQVPHVSDAAVFWTSAGRAADAWLARLAARLERVRVTHGAWHRCLNHHYGKNATAVFLDPPYRAYEVLYGSIEGSAGVADAVEAWCAANAGLRVCLAGHAGDYPSLEGWEVVPWSRGKLTYSGGKTTANECLWFSPGCST